LDIGEPIYGPKIPNFTDFMAPGIILLIIFFLAVALTGEAFILEKKDGLLDRLVGKLSTKLFLTFCAPLPPFSKTLYSYHKAPGLTLRETPTSLY
jgi:hypothetical protein